MSSNLDSTASSVECYRCGESIKFGVEFCSKCGGYQKQKWKNSAIFFAQISVGITIAASALLYFIDAAIDFKKTRFPSNEIEVLAYRDDKALILSNNGDGSILVEYLELFQIHPNEQIKRSSKIPIYKQVQSGEILIHKIEPRYGVHSSWSYVKNKYDIGSELWYALAEDVYQREHTCYRHYLRDVNDLDYTHVNKAYGGAESTAGVFTLPYQAKIHYYSRPSERNLIENFDVVAMVARYNTDQCQMRIE